LILIGHKKIDRSLPRTNLMRGIFLDKSQSKFFFFENKKRPFAHQK